MITIDQEVNCLGCKNSEVYICSNTMQEKRMASLIDIQAATNTKEYVIN